MATTPDFGSENQGSNPCIPTKIQLQTGSNGRPAAMIKEVKSSW